MSNPRLAEGILAFCNRQVVHNYIPRSRYSPPNQVLNLVDVAGQNLEG